MTTQELIRVRSGVASCGHELCALIGGACSLVAGFSRGCSSELRRPSEIDPQVFDEIRGMLAAIDSGGPDARDAAARLAAVVRREAREGRGVVAQARDAAPELAAQLERLCMRRR